jgi:hypothetical protein
MVCPTNLLDLFACRSGVALGLGFVLGGLGPLVGFLLGLVASDAVALLQLAYEFIALAAQGREIVVRAWPSAVSNFPGKACKNKEGGPCPSRPEEVVFAR